MISKTKSELIFELFCKLYDIKYAEIPKGTARTPDYVISLDGGEVFVEVKQIDKDENFQNPKRYGVSTRTCGNHIRQMISSSKKQVQVGAKARAPSILLVYNNLDPLQRFGTEAQDFISAMRGERTVVMKRGKIVDSFHGRNSSLRKDRNTSFSAIGHLCKTVSGAIIQLFENPYAQFPLSSVSLPPCITVVQTDVGTRCHP